MKHAASGQFELPLPAAEAIWLFTPEGERRWAPGWDPIYPSGDSAEADGTVFVTDADSAETIWVIINIDRPGGTATYARITPGHYAGTLRVQCVDSRPGHSTVTVSYAMTLLSVSHTRDFDGFSPTHFEATMHDWSGRIRIYLQDEVG